MNADRSGTANQIMHDGSVQQLKPARPGRFANDDMGDIALLRVREEVVGNPPAARKSDGLAAEPLGRSQRICDAGALSSGKSLAARCFDIDGGPWRMQTVGGSFGITNQPRGSRVFTDADQDALARRPRSCNGVRLHMGAELVVNTLRGAAKRQLAKRGEVTGREEVFERVLCLIRDVDLALRATSP